MKTFFRLTIVAACVMLVSACATPTIDKATLRQSDLPPLEEVKTEELGSTMLTQKNIEITRGRKVTQASRIITGWSFSTEILGMYLHASNGEYCGNATNRQSFRDGEKLFVCLSDKDFQENKIAYENAEEIAQVPTNFQRVVEYAGKSGNTLSVIYKEFNGELIRPAFTQEFKFDLSDSKVIGIKGARIEVIQANNIGITYKVISHFPR